jgi:hypothetical protein
MRTIPQDTIVRLELSESLSSKTARKGDQFTARLHERDRSGFPEGTRFDGLVVDAEKATKSKPGVLGVKVQRAILPGGTLVAFNGTLANLSDEDIRRTGSGRLESRGKSSKGKLNTTWIGYGAAGGAVLGTIFGGTGDLLKGALIGALGGAAYSYLNKDKNKSRGYSDVELSRGTEFGVRVHHQVAFRDQDRYRYAQYDPDRDNDFERDRARNRDRDLDRDRDFERDRDLDRDGDRNRDRDPDYRDRDRDPDPDFRDRDRDRDPDPDRTRRDRDRDPDRDL